MKNKQNETVSSSRRKVIAAGASGAVAGAVWHKPVINSVVTPAHAQMSAGMADDSLQTGQTFFLEGDPNQNVGAFDPVNLLISDAHAGGGQPGTDGWFSLQYLGSGEFSYEHLNRNSTVRRSGTVALGDVGVMEIVEDCRDTDNRDGRVNSADHFVQILGADSDGVSLSINDNTVVFVPAGSGSLPACGAFSNQPQ